MNNDSIERAIGQSTVKANCVEALKNSDSAILVYYSDKENEWRASWFNLDDGGIIALNRAANELLFSDDE